MPEKDIQEIPRAWREQYEKGKAAFDRDNLDYAIEILTNVLVAEPAFFDCRQALRATQFKRAGSGGPSVFKRLIGKTNPKLVQGQVVLRRNPLEALQLMEQVLNGNPNNLGAHKLLAEAALAADLPQTAALSLEIVFKQEPGDRDVGIKLAETLARIGQAPRAEAVMNELVRRYPHDPDVSQAFKSTTASRTLSEGGYEKIADGEGSYRDILRDEQQAVHLEQEQKEQKSGTSAERLLAEYQERLTAEPNDLRLIRKIADLLAGQGQYEAALEYYRRVNQTDGADPSLERAIVEVQLKQMDQAMQQLDPKAPDYDQRRAQLRAERQAFELGEAKRRVEHYPNDLQFHFELGCLYFEAGQLSEAIQEFQKAQSNPNKRIQALYYLGQCFAKRGMNDLAVRTFENAIHEKPTFDDEKKELVYALGLAYEKMGRREAAIEQLKQIYQVDIGYRDVATRVDAYYANQAANPPAT